LGLQAVKLRESPLIPVAQVGVPVLAQSLEIELVTHKDLG
jgi:hypothetical protein